MVMAGVRLWSALFILLASTTYCEGYSSQTTTSPYCNPSSGERFYRSNCGYRGICKRRCESRGCCFDPTYSDAHRCFCPNSVHVWYEPTPTYYYHDELRRVARVLGITVQYQYGTCRCEGRELRNSGKGPREFVVTCTKPRETQNVCVAQTSTTPYCNAKNKKNNKIINIPASCPSSTNSNTCTYKGNPHCNQYSGNERKFYDELLREIAIHQCNVIPYCPTTGTEFYTKKTCSNKEFKCIG